MVTMSIEGYNQGDGGTIRGTSIKKLVHPNGDFGSRSGVGPKQIIDFISQCLQKRGYFFGLEH